MTLRHLELIPPGTVTCLDGFVSAEECRALMEDLRFAWWSESPLIRRTPAGRLTSGTSFRRTSATTSEEWMGEDARDVLRDLERRLSDRMGIDPSHLEMWQATRYRRGERFDEHHDAGFFGDDPWGERTITILVYLDSQEGGGSTVFPQLGKRYLPCAGRVLMWRNLLLDGSVDERMRHAARPARSVKTILTTWARQRPTHAPHGEEDSPWLR